MSSNPGFTITKQDNTVVFGTFVESGKEKSPALMIYAQVPGGITFITSPWTKGFIFVKNRQPSNNDPT
jgi:hypothetical protein